MFNFARRPKEIEGESEIRIIGPRRAGKTTFLAALACWPNASKDSPIESVDPLDDPTGNLINQAQDILENGLIFAGNFAPDDPENLPLYTFLIRLKPAWFGREIQFQISCKDHPGEIFDHLRERNLFEGKIDQYLGDIANVSGFMLLIDGSSQKNQDDKEYAQALTALKAELDIRFNAQGKKLSSVRIAIVFSKAESPKVWSYRKDMQKFRNLKFPESTKMLAKWKKEWGCSISYFFCSSFGTIGSENKPNTKVVNDSVRIRRPAFWRPLGLAAPIYWLFTGKDDKRLRKLDD